MTYHCGKEIIGDSLKLHFTKPLSIYRPSFQNFSNTILNVGDSNRSKLFVANCWSE